VIPEPRSNPGELIGPAFTDLAGDPASPAQLHRLYSRYHWVRSYCQGARVVEVACGSGQGLAMLAEVARATIGADYSAENLAVVRRSYGAHLPLIRLDAHVLPLADASVDVILLLETLYFLPDPGAFVREAVRVLRPGGRLLISVINKDCWDFNPSPLYPHFFGAPELTALLSRAGLVTRCFGGFPLNRPSLRQRLFHPLKRIAIALHLIPRTVQARIWLKRIVFGRLQAIPSRLHSTDMPGEIPVPITGTVPDPVHQVLMVEGIQQDRPGR
jgi:SAM-dependent methyltransferase